MLHFANNRGDFNEGTKTIISKALMKMLNERDYSTQDVMFCIKGQQYYHSSREFKVVNLNYNDEEELIPISLGQNLNGDYDEGELSDENSTENALCETELSETHLPQFLQEKKRIRKNKPK